ncbi:serine/threonine protein phosphatase [Subtercola sp. Z020]|uniref:PP2C family protein-serine/threonine phosphatase n=1 Tax=Subtercola sp. Z020 TaxID=2080582 RepID=UPI000CE7EC24|nr:protein phosphatase 2C domain-containing protein [Subtercola sp. Z020]PPF75233.1 serine/threonine protein phosphatase [Subtercola sp. Z020]
MTELHSLSVAALGFRSGSATDTGLRRAGNEDALFAGFPIFVVADGMGGHDAGEVASARAVEAFASLAGAAHVSPAELRAAFDGAARAIAAILPGGARRAGTTVTGAAVAEIDGEAQWLVFNLGDSRTYRLANDRLEQVSVDHSVVQELVDEGEIDRAAAAVHPGRNIITRALGAGGVYRPDYWLLPIEPGDRLLLCSDGVSGELDNEELRAILVSQPEAQTASELLVNAALQRGGRDNLTAVVVDAFLL